MEFYTHKDLSVESISNGTEFGFVKDIRATYEAGVLTLYPKRASVVKEEYIVGEQFDKVVEYKQNNNIEEIVVYMLKDGKLAATELVQQRC
ncbi:hypothetical protein [Cognatishimia sp.]|uniref:hypothetical protein n=1 Tax=Cognatishimia sp. TaxID=2211648 RepID=UPI0035177584|nr:hypothetical protein [Cognatishimia sp.]